MFEQGRCYSRAEIHDQLGGGVQDYLPHVDGQVVCICVTPDMNPHAPSVLLVGNGESVRRYGGSLVWQQNPLPLFLKQAPNQWEYLGHYVVTGSSSAAADIAKWAGPAGREAEVTLVVYLEPAQTLA